MASSVRRPLHACKLSQRGGLQAAKGAATGESASGQWTRFVFNTARRPRSLMFQGHRAARAHFCFKVILVSSAFCATCNQHRSPLKTSTDCAHAMLSALCGNRPGMHASLCALCLSGYLTLLTERTCGATNMVCTYVAIHDLADAGGWV